MHFLLKSFDSDNKLFAKKKNSYKKYSRVPAWQRIRSAKKYFGNSNATFDCFSNGTSSSNRATTQRILCPDAPRNTTSFLINDMEERLSRDVSPPTPSVSPNSRARCCSTSVSDPSTSECPIAKLLPHEDDSEQADDYYDMVDALSCERLSGLTRDEINRQLIHVEEHNKDLVFHFTRLREENDNLKQLLKANGIDPQAATASS
jgi:hypothetical protein